MEAMLAVPLDQRPIYTKLMEATDIDCMGRKFYLPRHVGRHFQFADGDANTSATIANVQFIGYDMLLDEHLHLSKTRSAGNFPNYSIGSGWIECLAQQNMGEGDVIEFYVSPNNALNTMYIRHIPLYGDSSDEEEDFSDDAESTSSDEDESSSGEDRSSSDEDEDGSSSDEDEDENSSDEDGSSSDEYGNSSDEDGNGSSSDEDNGTKEDTSANEASDDIKHGAKINEVEGDVEKLYKDVAPKTVNFFRALCTGEKGLNGHKPLHYKGTRFIPVVRGVLVQGEDISSGETKYGESIYRALSVDVMVDNFGEIPEGADDGTINFFTDWPIDFKENLDDLPRDIAAVESSKALGNEWFKKQNYKMAMRKYCKSLRYLDLCWEMKGIDGDQGQYVRKVKSRNFNNIALIIACKKGGASIEDLVEKHPELIIKAPIDVFTGITDEDAAKVVDGLSIKVADRSASIEQINPIAETADNQLVAADAKLKFDHNTAYHQKEIFAYRDPTQVDPPKADLNYIGLDGEIGCLVNGSGLANATMDIIKLHGGTPANFLDVGGNASEGQVVEAFKILMVNIVGGIMKCDVIASGIVNVAKQDCMLKLGDLKGALMHGDFAIHDGRDNAKAFFCQGQVYMALNNTDGAIESFGKALELQPNNSSIKKEIALAKKKITHGDGVEKKAYSKMFQ